MELIDREELLKDLKTSAIYHANNSREETLMYRDRNIVREQPTVEAIPKADYENRLKADMVAMLTDMKDELKHCEITGLWKANYREGFNDGVSKSLDAIQQKINELKAESEDKE